MADRFARFAFDSGGDTDDMQSPGLDPSVKAEKPPSRLGWVVPIVFIAWLVAAFWLFGIAVTPLIDFSGDPIAADDQARSDQYMRIWAVVMTAGPAAIAILAGCLRMSKTAMAFGIVTVVLIGLVAAQPWVSRSFEPEPEPSGPEEPVFCIERSGGDSDCPGG